MPPHPLVLWTIRAATLLYAAAVARLLLRRPARALWAAGCAFYLAHVAAAFHFSYQWSHAIAVRETARQTNDLFGLDWGGGVYFNYAFTAIWTADALQWLLAPRARESRPRWVGYVVHGFIAWMFLNGAIVFPSGPVRWFSLLAAAALTFLWLRGRRLNS